jgi:hypothetical protein
MKTKATLLFLLLFSLNCLANSILIPMDDKQNNHLKAYGVAYRTLRTDTEVDWLVNYRGGSFLIKYSDNVEKECLVQGVSYQTISESSVQFLKNEISNPDANMDIIRLHRPAKIAVYSPVKVSLANFEDTDAVLLVLKHAEIPFTVVYDEEIIRGDLAKYDWLHLHHEDFTGQFGKNLRRMSAADMKAQEDIAKRFNYGNVPALKLDVAKAIKAFCMGGGYLFAMCSGAETFDIALSAEGVDIVGSQFDGDGIDPKAQQKLDFNKTLAFENFNLYLGESDDYGWGGGRGGGGISFSGY